MQLFSVKAARTIVAIQNRLTQGEVAPAERTQLVEEQRSIWDDLFPGQPLDAILAITKH